MSSYSLYMDHVDAAAAAAAVASVAAAAASVAAASRWQTTPHRIVSQVLLIQIKRETNVFPEFKGL